MEEDIKNKMKNQLMAALLPDRKGPPQIKENISWIDKFFRDFVKKDTKEIEE